MRLVAVLMRRRVAVLPLVVVGHDDCWSLNLSRIESEVVPKTGRSRGGSSPWVLRRWWEEQAKKGQCGLL